MAYPRSKSPTLTPSTCPKVGLLAFVEDLEQLTTREWASDKSEQGLDFAKGQPTRGPGTRESHREWVDLSDSRLLDRESALALGPAWPAVRQELGLVCSAGAGCGSICAEVRCAASCWVSRSILASDSSSFQPITPLP